MYFCFKRLHMAYLTFLKEKLDWKHFFQTLKKLSTFGWHFSGSIAILTNFSKQQELGTASHTCKNEVNLPLESVTSTKDLKGVWSTLWHLKYSNACNIFCPNFPKDFVYLLKIQLIIFDTNFEIVARS